MEMVSSKPIATGIRTLDALFRAEIRTLYAAELRDAEVLDRLSRVLESPSLRDVLSEHARCVQVHAGRMRDVFRSVGEAPGGDESGVFAAAADECLRLAGVARESPAHDAHVIASAQALTHLKIAGYGCLNAWARHLDHRRAAQLLKPMLEQEKQFDSRLSVLAGAINAAASRRTSAALGPL